MAKFNGLKNQGHSILGKTDLQVLGQFMMLKSSIMMQFSHLSCDMLLCYFQQCGILTCVDSDEPVQPLFKLRNSK